MVSNIISNLCYLEQVLALVKGGADVNEQNHKLNQQT